MANSVHLSVSEVEFENCLANQSYSQNVTLFNSTNASLHFTSFHDNSAFQLGTEDFTVASQDSLTFTIEVEGEQNIFYEDVLLLWDDTRGYTFALPLTADVHYNDNYDNVTFDLYDNALKSALSNFIDGHTELGYNLARDRMFDTIDNDNGSIECVYIGRVIQADNRDEAQAQGFNTEHTWPQSLGATGVAKSDLHHLYPTDATPNNIRGSFPFGNVVTGIDWQQAGSKRGYNADGDQVFEPRDVHKGDVARSMFYFALRYDNPNNFLNDQEAVLREWFVEDFVSDKEIDRNEQIDTYQHNRNPFVDHPEFLERIYSISTSATAPAEGADPFAAPAQMAFGDVSAGSLDTLWLYLVNYGDANCVITQVSETSPVFSVGTFSPVLEAGEHEEIAVIFAPTDSGNFSTTVQVQTNAGSFSCLVSGSSSAVPAENSWVTVPLQSMYFSAYPNPFNPVVNLDFTLPKETRVNIAVYNVAGQKVTTLCDESFSPGKHTLQWDAEAQGALASGVYFVRMETDQQMQIKKMVLMK